jgi:hypothetical protein
MGRNIGLSLLVSSRKTFITISIYNFSLNSLDTFNQRITHLLRKRSRHGDAIGNVRTIVLLETARTLPDLLDLIGIWNDIIFIMQCPDRVYANVLIQAPCDAY